MRSSRTCFAGRLNLGVRAHITHMDGALSISALALAIAFIPLAAAVARALLPMLKPPRYRPLFFVMGGLFMLAFGLLTAYTLRPALASGVIRFSSRHLGEVHAISAQEPMEYWAVVLLLYAIGVFFAGFGFAGVGLCFRKGQAGR